MQPTVISPGPCPLTQFGKSIGKTEQSLRTPVWLSGFGHVEASMNGIIYLIGLIVVVMAILSFLGLH